MKIKDEKAMLSFGGKLAKQLQPGDELVIGPGVYRETLQRLHVLSTRVAELQLVPSHCPEWRP